MRPIPDFKAFPDDADAWQALDGSLRNRAVSIPLMVMHWRSRVQFELDNAEPDADYNQRSLEGNSRLALGMLELAEALRRRYGWWDPEPPVVHRETKWLRPAVLAIEQRQNR